MDAAKLADRLRTHLQSPAFIKGWEVDKRTCVGAARQSLRKAARVAKALTVKRSGLNPSWLKAIDALQKELVAAGELDFDGLLSQALEAISTHGRGEIPVAVRALAAVEAHLKRDDLKKPTNAYETAIRAADLVRLARSEWLAAAAELQRKLNAYADTAEALCSELALIGESDFDGLLRQAAASLNHSKTFVDEHVPTGAMMNQAPKPPTEELVPSPMVELDGGERGETVEVPSPDSISSPERKKKKRLPPPPSLLYDNDDTESSVPTAMTPASAPTGEPAAVPAPAAEPVAIVTGLSGALPASLSGVAAPEQVVTTPPLPLQAASAGQLPAIPPLDVSEVDDGCIWLGTLPEAVQTALLREAFATGAKGVCGGLAPTSHAKGGGAHARMGVPRHIQGAHGVPYEPSGVTTTDWHGLGLHGNHTCGLTAGGAAEAVLAAVREVATRLTPEARLRMDDFKPDSIRVGFETMAERTIEPNGSLCGWSADSMRAERDDRSVKLLVCLGTAKSVTNSFKYKRHDAEALEVPLAPGEMLLLHGDGRSWVSAVTAFERGGETSSSERNAALVCPFDFVHLSLLDLRRMRQTKPSNVERLLCPEHPTPGDGSWRWMQCSYEVKTPESDKIGSPPLIELRGIR